MGAVIIDIIKSVIIICVLDPECRVSPKMGTDGHFIKTYKENQDY